MAASDHRHGARQAIAWQVAGIVAASLGAAWACVSLSSDVTVVLFIVSGAMGVVFDLATYPPPSPSAATPAATPAVSPTTASTTPAERSVHLAVTGLWAGVGAVAFSAIVVTVPALALLLLILAVTTSPLVVGAVRRHMSARNSAVRPNPLSGTDLVARSGITSRTRREARALLAHPGSTAVPSTPIEDVISVLDDRALCWAWRLSFAQLNEAATLDDRMRIVDMRAVYLEELHRRNPAADQAWLLAGGRASSDPARYLSNIADDPGQHL